MGGVLNLLIVGAGGQVGRELVRLADHSRDRVTALDRSGLDLADPERVRAAVRRTTPDVVLNAAAYAAVDRAESEPERAFSVNRDGPRHLAEACAETGAALIHLSTDFVFDGRTDRPYLEDDPVSPLGVYGQSKADGEAAVRAALDRHLIVRASWVFGVFGQNFAKTMIRLGREREILRVVDDQRGCPTCAADLARTLLRLARAVRDSESVPWGVYHFCGKGVATWREFAVAVLESARARVPLAVREIRPISTAEYPTPARRPAFSALDCGKIGKNFGIHPRPWRECLPEVVEDIVRLEEGISRDIVGGPRFEGDAGGARLG